MDRCFMCNSQTNPMNDPEPDLCSGCLALGDEPVRAARRAQRVRSLPNLLTVADLANLPRPEPIIEGVLNKHTVTTLIGPRNVGKSFITLSWGLSLATGHPWLGRDVQRTPVLLVVKEGLYGLQQRIEAWRSSWMPGADLSDFHILRVRRSLWHPEYGPNLDEVRDVAQEYGCGLTILDTASSLFTGLEENSNRDAAMVLDRLDTLREDVQGTVLLVHHTGKNSAAGSRGASAWEGNVDEVIEANYPSEGVREDGEPIDPSMFTIRTKKVKDGAPWKMLVRRRVVSLVDGSTSCVVEYQRKEERESEMNDYLMSRIDAMFYTQRDGMQKTTCARQLAGQNGALSSQFYTTWNTFVERGWLYTSDTGNRGQIWKMSDERRAMLDDDPYYSSKAARLE